MARSRAVDLLRRNVRFGNSDESPADPAEWQPEARRVETLWVERALEDLPQPQRATVRLAFYQGFSHSQIARMLDRPLGTVKTQIRTCLISLREAMAQ